MFCTQIQKISIFWADARLHKSCITSERYARYENLRKTWKKKVAAKNREIIARNVEGGGFHPPPPRSD